MENFAGQILLRADEVGVLLGMNERQLYMAVRRGQIPARKMGRRVVFLRAELELYLENLPHVAKPAAVETGDVVMA